MAEAVIIDAIRTPIGRNNGALKNTRPDNLYALVINELIRRNDIDGRNIDDVITGCVTQVNEQGANIGRLAVLLSDLPNVVPATTLNRMCGSSQQAVHFAAQSVAAEDSKYIIAGGVESMTRTPMFSDVEGGYDNLNQGIREKYELIHQGESAERMAECYNLSRQELDKYGYQSHLRAAKATQAGYFEDQMMTVQAVDSDGTLSQLNYDEGIRFTPDLEKMLSLHPIFRPDGVITAANSSQISDGASGILIGDRGKALADGHKPKARFVSRVVVGGDPTIQLLEVIPATKVALQRGRLSPSDIDVIEINEAFASVVLAWATEFQPDMDRVNPNGGAIAHGHPLGATGALLMTKLLHELEQTGGQFGLQVMCIGHGMATATIIERI